jgi:hypothetical protein
MIIVTSHDPNCLEAYLVTCQETIRPLLSIETGYTDRLVINKEDFDKLSIIDQVMLKAEAQGFVNGWNAKADER